MEKVLFVINNLETGGVQNSLCNLLKEIVDYYDITVMTFYDKPIYHNLLPQGIKVISTHSPFRYLGMSQDAARATPWDFGCRSFWAIVTKCIGRSAAIKLMAPFQKRIKGYDVAVSFLHEAPQSTLYGGCNEFVLKRTDATRKMSWIHCDFGSSGANNKQSRKIYTRFDFVFACSEGTKNAFVKCVPDLKDRCVAIRNCIDYKTIRSNSNPAVEYNKDYFNVVTVARLSSEKGIDRMLYAIYEAIMAGFRVKYHIIGSGKEELTLKSLTNQLGLSDYVHFYGNKKNPYPYMVNADLFVLPSYHEAAPMVFDEAVCLGLPVLATKTTSTDEMILAENLGIVCENSQQGIRDGLMYALKNPDVLSDIRGRLQQHIFTNEESIKKLRSII